VHRRRPDGQDDIRSADCLNAVRHQLDPQPMWIDKHRVARQDVHAVADQLMPGDVDLVADDVVHAEKQIAHGDALLDRVRGPIDSAFAVSGQAESGFAQRLARNGAGVDADAANDGPLFDDGDSFVELGGLNGGPMPRRSRTMTKRAYS
jgi:hypothetical protein